jgi:D-sedoheptulose 7-phosphate isomerase
MKNESIEVIRSTLQSCRDAVDTLLSNEETLKSISKASKILTASLQESGRVFSCGNGGSMCDAMHFAEELTGRFREDRKAISAIAIADSSHISCVANDYGYEQVFSRYLEANGRKNDVLLAISTSGSSKNVVKAAETALKLGLKVIAMTGKRDCELAKFSTIHLPTPAGKWADRVQELHIKVIHILIDLIERDLAR